MEQNEQNNEKILNKKMTLIQMSYIEIDIRGLICYLSAKKKNFDVAHI